MAKQQAIEIVGTITKDLSNSLFELTMDNGHIVQCTISGKIRMNGIRIMVGDTCTAKVSPYDLTKGIITFRGVSKSRDNNFKKDKQNKGKNRR